MSAPHNPARLGELWNPNRLTVLRAEIEAVRSLVVISGGWAWHYMTPDGHAELKHAHDHKDADLFVQPDRFATLVGLLKDRGFERTWTRFDDRPGADTFYRYTKSAEEANGAVKVMLDVFVEEVPFVQVGEVRVVEPKYLLSLYGTKHSSDLCFSVRIARKLLAAGENPVWHSSMADYKEFVDGEAGLQKKSR